MKPTTNAAGRNGHSEWAALLDRVSRRSAEQVYGDNDTIFMQGQAADSLYFVQRGKDIFLREAGIVFEAVAANQFAAVRRRGRNHGSKRSNVCRQVFEVEMGETKGKGSLGDAPAAIVKDVPTEHGYEQRFVE